MPREAVCDHAADEEEEDLRQDRERQHEPELCRAPVQLEHREREGDRSHRRPSERDDTAEEEEAEIPLP